MRLVCMVEGCSGLRSGFGFCNKHYIAAKKYGDPKGGIKPQGSIEERFWRRVDRKGVDECWEWTGYLLPNGYGRISVGTKAEGSITTHRLSCKMHHGEPPFEGAHVMHLCDNRRCVNPAHLRWATASENIQDAFDKGRKVSPFNKGVSHHGAVLNEDQVRHIKRHPELRVSEVVRLFGCSRSAVDAIRSGRTWRHVLI